MVNIIFFFAKLSALNETCFFCFQCVYVAGSKWKCNVFFWGYSFQKTTFSIQKQQRLFFHCIFAGLSQNYIQIWLQHLVICCVVFVCKCKKFRKFLSLKNEEEKIFFLMSSMMMQVKKTSIFFKWQESKSFFSSFLTTKKKLCCKLRCSIFHSFAFFSNKFRFVWIKLNERGKKELRKNTYWARRIVTISETQFCCT